MKAAVPNLAAIASLLLYPPWWINQNAARLEAGEARATASLGAREVQESRSHPICPVSEPKAWFTSRAH